MARPLQYVPRLPTPEERLNEAHSESQEALIEALKLLRALHAHGVLDVTTDLVKGGAPLTEHLLGAANQPGSLRALRNLAVLAETLGQIDPDDLQAVGKVLGAGVRGGANLIRNGRRYGRLGLMLGAGVGALAVVGRLVSKRG